jgi:ParB family chromosome partitioning protein
MANLSKIPVIVRTLSEQHKVEIALVENIQRQDLNPLETATAIANLKSQFNMTERAIAKRLGKATSTVSNQLRLLELPKIAKEKVLSGAITEGHARQILALIAAGGNDKDVQKLLDKTEHDHWSVRRAEQFVNDFKKMKLSANTDKEPVQTIALLSPKAEKLFRSNLTKRFSLPEKRIKIAPSGKRLKLTIEFLDAEELASFQKHL